MRKKGDLHDTSLALLLTMKKMVRTTLADMKKEFAKECNGNSDIFDSYHEWYIDEGDDARTELRDRAIAEISKEKLDAMSIEELEKYLAG